jgi:hypothetical protein
VRLRCWAKTVGTGGVLPQLAFVIQVPGSAAQRILTVQAFPITISNTLWQEFTCILNVNPVTGLAWTPAMLSSNVWFGIANVAPAGVTQELRVAELWAEFYVSYG